MNIPALNGVDFDESWDSKTAVLDGYNHCVYLDPAPELRCPLLCSGPGPTV